MSQNGEKANVLSAAMHDLGLIKRRNTCFPYGAVGVCAKKRTGRTSMHPYRSFEAFSTKVSN
jgi:hypothetical protein